MVFLALAVVIASGFFGYLLLNRGDECWTAACRVEQARAAEQAWADVQRIIEQRVTLAQKLKSEVSAEGDARLRGASRALDEARAATYQVPSNFFGNSWGQPLLYRIAEAQTELNRVNYMVSNANEPIDVGLAPFVVPAVATERPSTGASMEKLLAETALLKKAVGLTLERLGDADLMRLTSLKGYGQALDQNQGALSEALKRYNDAANAIRRSPPSGSPPFVVALEPDETKLMLELQNLPEFEIVSADDVRGQYESQARTRAMADIDAINARAAILEQYASDRMRRIER